MVLFALMDRISDFLNTIIFQNSWIFINFWSIVHIILGFLVMLFLIKKFKMSFWKSFSIFVSLLVIWELFEFSFYSRSDWLFKAETNLDVIWDILSGMLGGALCFRLNGDKKPKKIKKK